MVQNKTFDFNNAPVAPVPSVPGKRGGPVMSWRSGALNVCVWENESTTAEGQVQRYHTVSFERRYKDKNGEWKSTNNLRLNDLPKAALLLNKAYEYLLLGEEPDE